jgi:hypothetical protein
MILFTILAIMFAFLLIGGIAILAIGGASFIIVFADMIVCALVIFWIMKRLIGRKKK